MLNGKNRKNKVSHIKRNLKRTALLKVPVEFKTLIHQIAVDYEKATLRWLSTREVANILYNKTARADWFSAFYTDMVLQKLGKMTELLPVVILDPTDTETAKEIMQTLSKLDKPFVYATSEDAIVIVLLRGYPAHYFIEIAGGKEEGGSVEGGSDAKKEEE